MSPFVKSFLIWFAIGCIIGNVAIAILMRHH